MNWVDVLVIVLALLAAISGARQGIVIALPALVGVVGGAILGIRIAPLIVDLFQNPAAKVAFAVAVVVFLVALGETLGVWAGRRIKHAVKSRVNTSKLSGIDQTLGAIVQALVVFVVAWLIAVPLTAVASMPGLAKAINSSAVLGAVDRAMPAAAEGLPADLRKLLDVSGFPSIVDPFQQTQINEVAPPDPSLPSSAVAAQLRGSVLKIRGTAPSCSRALEGSGFVVAPQRVMTNAHVVAGTDETAVETPQGRLPARVVYFDPEVDIAVLAVPRLQAQPLTIAPTPGKAGDSTIVLGYPLDGPYTATAGRIRNEITLQGPDIYDSRTVRRDVFTVRAQVRSGNSGGPMVNPQGEVVGVVFGASVQDPDTGFTLTVKQVRSAIDAAPSLSAQVGTGACAA
ncbi:MarP family serine protease [Amycolatopsis alkalitolerans]|uniref:MarP family serine protease n=1 Tax=Amycolatopsis alkalitolerans TaxID=2547244 RepID=A0A5C4M066_9PSEU|nr:MarP family serine protease [Amycolatopsis alkalitolerans]TNC22936.1 MarP family serine protease [Amycolatopsis alkalitolerans]